MYFLIHTDAIKWIDPRDYKGGRSRIPDTPAQVIHATVQGPTAVDSALRMLQEFIEYYTFQFDPAKYVLTISKAGQVERSEKHWAGEDFKHNALMIEHPTTEGNTVYTLRAEGYAIFHDALVSTAAHLNSRMLESKGDTPREEAEDEDDDAVA